MVGFPDRITSIDARELGRNIEQAGSHCDEAAFASAGSLLGVDRSERLDLAQPTQSFVELSDGLRRYDMPYSGIHTHEYSEGQFAKLTKRALGKINSTTSGKRLLDDISAVAGEPSGKHISIVECQTPVTRPVLTVRQAQKKGAEPDPFSDEQHLAAWRLATSRKLIGIKLGKGPGTSAEIGWSPDRSLELDKNGRPYEGLSYDSSEAHANLAHELVHAFHMLRGDAKEVDGDRFDPKTQRGKEELRAVGLGKYSRSPYSENSIRRELGLPERTQYKGVRRSQNQESPQSSVQAD